MDKIFIRTKGRGTTRPLIQTILATYENGKVKTSSGDIWEAKKFSGLSIDEQKQFKRNRRDFLGVTLEADE